MLVEILKSCYANMVCQKIKRLAAKRRLSGNYNGCQAEKSVRPRNSVRPRKSVRQEKGCQAGKRLPGRRKAVRQGKG
jgi:hypothetical protein